MYTCHYISVLPLPLYLLSGVDMSVYLVSAYQVNQQTVGMVRELLIMSTKLNSNIQVCDFMYQYCDFSIYAVEMLHFLVPDSSVVCCLFGFVHWILSQIVSVFFCWVQLCFSLSRVLFGIRSGSCCHGNASSFSVPAGYREDKELGIQVADAGHEHRQETGYKGSGGWTDFLWKCRTECD